MQSKLLILDDDTESANALAAISQAADFETRQTVDADAFLTLLDDWQPNLVVVDLMVQDSEGIQLLTALSQRGITAGIVLTSRLEYQILQAASRAAVSHGLNILGILQKPFHTDLFLNLIHSHLLPDTVKAGETAAKTRQIIDTGDLQQAIENQALDIVVQPKLDCNSHLLVGFEVLARWQHPQLGFIPPDQFIAIAENNQLINPLTIVILQKAIPWLAEFNRLHRATRNHGLSRNLTCSVNISAVSLKNADLLNALVNVFDQCHIQAEQIILELTETGAMDDPATSLAILNSFRKHGFQLSIDDFGTGFSSMLQLVRMPFSEVKIDKSFILTATTTRESRLVIKAIIDLAHSLGMLVTAEGIEDNETLNLLQQLGCDKGQGYYLAAPLQLTQVDDWLQAHNKSVENKRLQGLQSMNLLRTKSESRFDRLTRLAKRLFNVPISYISMIDADSQWFKSREGLDIDHTPREYAFCNETIQSDEIFLVQDTHQDQHYQHNPLVTGAPFIRFYAGYPIKAPTGERLGSMCVVDNEPRTFSAEDTALLQQLAAMVETELASHSLATEDPLTGFINRRGFDNRAMQLMNLCYRQKMPSALLYLALDTDNHHYPLHDKQGMDDVIKALATILSQCVRDSDLVSRLSRVEFAVLMINYKAESYSSISQRIADAIAQYNQRAEPQRRLAIQFNVVNTEQSNRADLDALLDYASAHCLSAE